MTLTEIARTITEIAAFGKTLRVAKPGAIRDNVARACRVHKTYFDMGAGRESLATFGREGLEVAEKAARLCHWGEKWAMVNRGPEFDRRRDAFDIAALEALNAIATLAQKEEQS